MRTSLLVASLALAPAVALAAPTPPAPPAAAPIAPAPTLFAPGVISGPANDGSPTFAPDANTLLFTRSTAGWSAILESHRTGGPADASGTWSSPELAQFSGEWPDSSPAFAPDGSYAIFVSLRPKDDAHPHSRIAQLYRADRTPGAPGTHNAWSAPVKLPAEVNIGPSIWKPSVGTDGTIYFVSIDTAGHKRLYSAARAGDHYQAAKPLPFSSGTTGDVDPEISTDGKLLVFCSSGRTKGVDKDRLYYVRKTATGWSDVRALRYTGDDTDGPSADQEPHLAPDQKTLYFSSDRAGHVEFPRTHAQAVDDEKRLEAWDNSNANVWTMSIANVI